MNEKAYGELCSCLGAGVRWDLLSAMSLSVSLCLGGSLLLTLSNVISRG